MVSRPRPQSLITQAAPLLDQAAAELCMRTKHRLFNEAWTILTPQIHALVAAYLGGITGAADVEFAKDAFTQAGRKVWGSVAKGYQPEHGYESTVARTVQRAAADIISRNKRHIDNRPLSIDAQTYLEDDDASSWVSTDDGGISDVLDTLTQAAHRTRLTRAANRARILGNPTAAQLLTEGIADSIAHTARTMRTTEKAVNTALDWIRDNTYALFVCSDTRFYEHAHDENPQHQLVIGA